MHLKPNYAVWIGLVLLLLWLWLRHTDTTAHTPWSGPVGTRWAGTELRGMQQWGGYFSNVSLAGEYLELRCRRWPWLRTRKDYWPGAEWRGWAEWSADTVTYQPGWRETAKPKVKPLSLPAPWWLQVCPKT